MQIISCLEIAIDHENVSKSELVGFPKLAII